MEAQFQTDRGQVREHNEDAGGIFYNEANQVLAIIADGMGGHSAGDVASETAVSLFKKEWEQTETFTSPESIADWLKELLEKTNKKIYELSLEKKDYQGMGTTVVVAVIIKDFVTIGHVGDSRCYIINEAGFRQITEDHSLVNELVRSGEISKDEALVHPRKNIVLKALGTSEEVTPEINCVGWEQGNKLLLCSDGLTDKLTNEELATALSEASKVQEVTKDLIRVANDRGGEDNISVIVINHASHDREAGDQSC